MIRAAPSGNPRGPIVPVVPVEAIMYRLLLPALLAVSLTLLLPATARRTTGIVAAITLGRPLSGNAANTTVNIVEPGTLYGDRINQLDIRLAKILRFGRTRTQVGLDVYNVTNSSAIQTYNQTYGARYLTPTLVLPARFAKVSAQFDF
jgi:hypothetical protein